MSGLLSRAENAALSALDNEHERLSSNGIKDHEERRPLAHTSAAGAAWCLLGVAVGGMCRRGPLGTVPPALRA